jgi:hypothetical protein
MIKSNVVQIAKLITHASALVFGAFLCPKGSEAEVRRIRRRSRSRAGRSSGIGVMGVALRVPWERSSGEVPAGAGRSQLPPTARQPMVSWQMPLLLMARQAEPSQVHSAAGRQLSP